MKKRGGLLGMIVSFVSFVIIVALLISFLSLHDWDIFEAISWLISKTWEIIQNLVRVLTNSHEFRSIAK